MRLFEASVDGKMYGYIVDDKTIMGITKKGTKVSVQQSSAEHGEFETVFDLTKLPMYTIG